MRTYTNKIPRKVWDLARSRDSIHNGTTKAMLISRSCIPYIATGKSLYSRCLNMYTHTITQSHASVYTWVVTHIYSNPAGPEHHPPLRRCEKTVLHNGGKFYGGVLKPCLLHLRLGFWLRFGCLEHQAFVLSFLLGHQGLPGVGKKTQLRRNRADEHTRSYKYVRK